jgi:hypothetical protein
MHRVGALPTNLFILKKLNRAGSNEPTTFGFLERCGLHWESQQTERDRICFRVSFYFYFFKYFLFKIIFLDFFNYFI